MARIRSIKPEFWQDSRMAHLPALTRTVFLCLWSMADDEGRLEGDAMAVWRFGSFREDSREVASALETLRGLSRVLLYEVEGNPYIQVVNFTKHQRIDHASKSKYPAYTNGCDLLQESSRGTQESSRILAPDLEQGAGSREQGSGAGNGSGKRNVKPVSGAVPAPGRTIPVWESYSAAYKARHGAEPTRNRRVNGQLAAFLELVPVEQAPDIAAFFVRHNNRLYVNAMHALNLLVRDAEKLRTEWQTGRPMTSLEARGAEAGDAVAQQARRVGLLLGEPE